MIDPPKKLTILYILDILARETNFDHRLTQQQIIHILDRDYGVTAERKSIARNIQYLIDADYDIVCDDGYYLCSRTFAYSELRLIIDSILFSKNIPQKQGMALIEKLIGLTDKYFKADVNHVATLNAGNSDHRQVFFTVEILNEAISKGKKVSFYYNEYRTDKMLHRKREKPYIVSPYQIAAANGRYYLICNTDPYDNIIHYRIDHIDNASILAENIRPMKEIEGLENGLDLPRHMAEHIYMFSGASKRVLFRANLTVVDQVIDWFGKDISFQNETENTVDISVRVNEAAMFCWLLQYGAACEVLKPATLRARLKEATKKMAEKYDKEPEY